MAALAMAISPLVGVRSSALPRMPVFSVGWGAEPAARTGVAVGAAVAADTAVGSAGGACGVLLRPQAASRMALARTSARRLTRSIVSSASLAAKTKFYGHNSRITFVFWDRSVRAGLNPARTLLSHNCVDTA